MKRLIALLMTLVLIFGCACAQEVQPAAPAAMIAAPVITATGVGQVSIPADCALLTLYLSGRGETIDEAQQRAQTVQTAVLDSLTAAGTAPEDICTGHWDVEALYDYHYTKLSETKVVNGYSVQTSVDVTIHDVDRVGELVAAAVEGGAGTGYEVVFQSTQTAAAYSQALAAAAQNALAKASQLAESCGLALGQLVSVTELTPTADAYALTVTAAVEVAYSVQ